MLLFHRTFYFATVLALVSGLYACSASQPSGESGNPGSSGAEAVSGADAVGSVPEDMLATETLPDSTDAAPVDPFADLQEKEITDGDSGAQNALAVPEGDSESSSSSAGTGAMEKYKVKAGDTLMKIAFSIYGDVDRWKDLYDLNRGDLKKGQDLRKGMMLRYEVPSEPFHLNQLEHSYEIKKGDTLALIADEVYGRKMKYKKLQKYNAQLIRNPNRIFAGFTIFYDITPKEMAEAEARRAQRMAGGNPADSAPAPLPSAINPPPEADPLQGAPSAAVAPTASDNSAVSGPGPAPLPASPPSATGGPLPAPTPASN